MHRSRTHDLDCAAMRTVEFAAIKLLLRAARRERRKSAADAEARQSVHGPAVFRQPAHGEMAGCESQADAAIDAHDGHRSTVSQASVERPRARSQDLSVPVAGSCDRGAESRLEHGFYVCSDAWRLFVLGRRDGLVQPLCAGLGAVVDDGNGVLRGGAGSGVAAWQAEDFQLRSGLTIYVR